MTKPDPIAIARDLLRCPSVTPDEGGALAYLDGVLRAAGFAVHRMTFSEPGTADVENLYARIGTGMPHLMFAGHTDVVPPGDPKSWSHAPFAGEIADGVLFGRGAVDMKGAIACKVAATLDYLAANGGKPKGSISFLITGDEEGIAVNGTVKLLKWAAERGEKFSHCILGEPGNVARARRHHQARPPRLAERRAGRDRQAGARRLPAARRQSGARAGQADGGADGRAARQGQRAFRSVEPGVHLDRYRQSDRQSDPGRGARALQHPLQRLPQTTRRSRRWWRSAPAAAAGQGRAGGSTGSRRTPTCSTPSPASSPTAWSARSPRSTGRKPKLSTSGGTSDARFIKDYCPVVEFGLVGTTMHAVDERVPVADLTTLTAVYRRILDKYFG